MTFQPPVEPYRIKSVEPIHLLPAAERRHRLERAHYNLFRLDSQDVFIDLLTDSGTGAMSAAQWAAIMVGDEAYANARSFYHLQESIRDILGFDLFLPVHQGRAAEHLFFSTLLAPGDRVASNMLFDTTRANIEAVGAIGVDLPIPEALDTTHEHPFKGNVDVDALRRLLAGPQGKSVKLIHVTITNNSGGGQPVSYDNLRAVRALADEFHVPFFLDGCRFAENAYFVHEREPGQRGRPVRDIVRDVFDLADGTIVSAKKDGLANIGGFLALREETPLVEKLRQRLILTEGFPTYGGLAGRDLEAIAQGLREVVDETYLAHRVGQVRYLAQRLETHGIPIVRPPGGHALYLDATRFLPHIPPEQFPGQALACELYLEGGIRTSEIGSLMFGPPVKGGPARLELVRLALPRRTYTESHLAFVANAVAEVWKRRATITGYALQTPPDVPLRHFTAQLRPVTPAAPGKAHRPTVSRTISF